MGYESFDYSKMDNNEQKIAFNNIKKKCLKDLPSWGIFEVDPTKKDFQGNFDKWNADIEANIGAKNSIFSQAVKELGSKDMFDLISKGDNDISQSDLASLDFDHDGKITNTDMTSLVNMALAIQDEPAQQQQQPVVDKNENKQPTVVDKNENKQQNQQIDANKDANADKIKELEKDAAILDGKGIPTETRVKLGADGKYKVKVESWTKKTAHDNSVDNCVSKIVYNSYNKVNLTPAQEKQIEAEIVKRNHLKNVNVVQDGAMLEIPAIKLDEKGNILVKDNKIVFYKPEEIKEALDAKNQAEKLKKTAQKPDDKKFGSTVIPQNNQAQDQDEAPKTETTYNPVTHEAVGMTKTSIDKNGVTTVINLDKDGKNETSRLVINADKTATYIMSGTVDGKPNTTVIKYKNYDIAAKDGTVLGYTDYNQSYTNDISSLKDTNKTQDVKINYDTSGNKTGSTFITYKSDGTTSTIEKHYDGQTWTEDKPVVKDKSGSIVKPDPTVALMDTVKADLDQLNKDCATYPEIDRNSEMAKIFNKIPKDQLVKFITEYDKASGADGSFMKDIGYAAGTIGYYDEYNKRPYENYNGDVYKEIKDAYKDNTLGLIKALTGGSYGELFNELTNSLTEGDKDDLYNLVNKDLKYKNLEDVKAVLNFINSTYPSSSAPYYTDIDNSKDKIKTKIRDAYDGIYPPEILTGLEDLASGKTNVVKPLPSEYETDPSTIKIKMDDISKQSIPDKVNSVKKEVNQLSQDIKNRPDIDKYRRMEAIFNQIPQNELAEFIKQYDGDKPGSFMKDVGYDALTTGYDSTQGFVSSVNDGVYKKIKDTYKNDPVALMKAITGGSDKSYGFNSCMSFLEEGKDDVYKFINTKLKYTNPEDVKAVLTFFNNTCSKYDYDTFKKSAKSFADNYYKSYSKQYENDNIVRSNMYNLKQNYNLE